MNTSVTDLVQASTGHYAPRVVRESFGAAAAIAGEVGAPFVYWHTGAGQTGWLVLAVAKSGFLIETRASGDLDNWTCDDCERGSDSQGWVKPEHVDCTTSLIPLADVARIEVREAKGFSPDVRSSGSERYVRATHVLVLRDGREITVPYVEPQLYDYANETAGRFVETVVRGVADAQ